MRDKITILLGGIMEDKIDVYILCPKCLKRLKLRRENWIETPYCYNCDTRYNIKFDVEEIKLTIAEKGRIFGTSM